MLHIAFLQLYRFRIVFQVIVALRQRQSALIGLGNLHFGILEIRTGAKAKKSAYAYAMQVGNFIDKLSFALYGIDAVKFQFQHRNAFLVDGRFVHAGSVVVSDLLLSRGTFRRRCGLFKNSTQNCAVALCQFIEASPYWLVSRNRVVPDPSAAGKLVEVNTGISTLI